MKTVRWSWKPTDKASKRTLSWDSVMKLLFTTSGIKFLHFYTLEIFLQLTRFIVSPTILFLFFFHILHQTVPSLSPIFSSSLSLHLCGPHYVPLSDNSHCFPSLSPPLWLIWYTDILLVGPGGFPDQSDGGKRDQMTWTPIVMGKEKGEEKV